MHEDERAHVEVHLTGQQFNASGPPEVVNGLFHRWLEECASTPGMAHALHRINARLDTVLLRLGLVLEREVQMVKELEDLTAEVVETQGVERSALAAIEGFAALLKQAVVDATDYASLKAGVVEQVAALLAKRQELAAGIAANPLPPTP